MRALGLVTLRNYMSNDSHKIYGIKYYGQYKPTFSYKLGDYLYIVPSGWEMVDYGPAKIRQNISYFISEESETEDSLKEKFRDWLIFDSFILCDGFPVYFYDENTIGNTVEIFDSNFINISTDPTEYKSTNYNDIGSIVLLTRENEMELSYIDLYKTYNSLSGKDKDIIEWFVSKPSKKHSRLNPIYNVRYWQLFHLTVILEKLIGLPPRCTQQFEKCTECNYEAQPHYSVSRNKWLDDYLNNLINEKDIKDQYRKIIIQAFQLRNKFAHNPLIDKSGYPEIPIGFTDIYGHDRAIDEYKENSIALDSLLRTLSEICRYFLLNKFFKLNFFKKITPLMATTVGNSGAA